MAKLIWDKVGEHWYNHGVSKGVLFRMDNNVYGKGVAWSGLRSVEESPSGAESNKFYADNDVYLNILSKEIYGATIGAYTYPPEFEECNGEKELATGVKIGQQPRKPFALAYRTEKGNDANSSAGYVIHIMYGALVSPSSKSHQTMGDTPSPEELSWPVSTTPIEVPSQDTKTSTIEIDSTKVNAEKLAKLEAMLYGTDAGEGSTAQDPTLPMPEDLVRIFAEG